MILTVELDRDEVKIAITKYLESKGFEVHSVDLTIRMVSTGYGPTERNVPGFKHARCEVELKSPPDLNEYLNY
jgi:hypothetical protein